MNLILLDAPDFPEPAVARLTDGRARHITSVLKAKPGAILRIGLRNGPRGVGTLLAGTEHEVLLACAFEEKPPPRPPLDLLLALPRPKVLKRLWAQLAALGVDRIILTNAARVERNYFDTHVVEPAFYTPAAGRRLAAGPGHPPSAGHHSPPVQAPDGRRTGRAIRRAPIRLLADPAAVTPARRTTGPTGSCWPWDPKAAGWISSASCCDNTAFSPFSLGPRTLRTDTACIALLAVVAHPIKLRLATCNPKLETIIVTERFLHTGLVADPICKMHDAGWGHPETPSRYDAVFRALCTSGLIEHLEKIPARPGHRKRIPRAHTAGLPRAGPARDRGRGRHPQHRRRRCLRPSRGRPRNTRSGGCLNAVDAVLDGRIKNAFCLVRPPGHHATARPRHGLLHLQQRRPGRPPRAGPRGASRADRGLGCPPRQRHAGHFLRRRLGLLLQHPPGRPLSPHRGRPRNRARSRRRRQPEHPAARGRRPRRNPRRL
jgi:16S rRNA (uracil1498-N3)-methyltransferase